MNTNPMTPPSAGGVAGVLESLSVKWHMEANALDKSFSPGSGIMAAERRARALELEAALAAIGSAAPAGDGECCANSGTYACKCSQFTPATPAGDGALPLLEPGSPEMQPGYPGDAAIAKAFRVVSTRYATDDACHYAAEIVRLARRLVAEAAAPSETGATP